MTSQKLAGRECSKIVSRSPRPSGSSSLGAIHIALLAIGLALRTDVLRRCLQFTAVSGDVGLGAVARCVLRECLGLLVLRGGRIHLRLSRLIRANELAVLFKDGPDLFFDAHVPKYRIERLAAGHQVVWMVGATLGGRKQMLETRLIFRDVAVAEEAELTLQKHHALEWSGGHRVELPFAFLALIGKRVAVPS